MCRKSFLFSFLIFICSYSYGTNVVCNLNDSIKFSKEFKVLQNRILQLNDSSSYYFTLDPSKSYILADSAYRISARIDYCKGKLESIYNMGNALFAKGNIERSRQLFDYAIKGSEILKIWSLNGKSYLSKAKIDLISGNFKQCLEFCFVSIKSFYKANDFEGIAKAYVIIGITYAKSNDFDRAIVFNNRAYSILRVLDVKSDLAHVINNNAIIFVQQGKLDLGLKSFQEVLQINIEQNELSHQALNLLNIGKIYLIKEDYEEAEQYLKKSLQINSKYKFYQGLALSHSNLGDLYLSQNKLDLAIYHLLNAEKISEEYGLNVELQLVYERLALVYDKKNDYFNALKYFKANKNLSDSISKSRINQDLYLVEERYQNEINKTLLEMQVRDNEILRLKVYENVFFKSLFFGALAIFVLVIFVYSYILISRKKTNKKLLELNSALIETNNKLVITEAELRELNATKDKFFSLISHDLRNPFASLVSFIRIMNRDYESMNKEEVMELIAELKKTTDSAQDLLENLLLWSRTQTRNIVFRPETFNLHEVIINANNLYSSILKTKGLKIEIVCDSSHQINADKNMVSTIIRNLIQNAIKYSLPKNKIEVIAEKNENYHIISVRDYGIGMDENTKNKLFKSGTSNTKRGTFEEKGSGIGLLICNEFVNYHKGEIEVESELGKGTAIKVYIPRD